MPWPKFLAAGHELERRADERSAAQEAAAQSQRQWDAMERRANG